MQVLRTLVTFGEGLKDPQSSQGDTDLELDAKLMPNSSNFAKAQRVNS